MKRILSFLIFILLAMGVSAAGAQTVVMDEGHVAFDYPDSWLVVSPQLCGVYAPLLADAGLDADDVAKELTDTRTLSRAYNADYTQYLAVLIREDELSQEIYEIDAMTDAQKTTLRRRAESNSLWETTGLRAQDVEWQKENGENWLYIHYIVTRSGTTVGRGLRYVTVHNGLYVELDWRIESGRFSGRDLNAFRARLAEYNGISKEDLRKNMAVFLRAIVPVAEEVGVRLAVHPDDPPRPILGLPRIVSTIEDMQWLKETVDSINNGFTMCTGSYGVRADNDLVKMIETFGDRIHFTHLRSTCREDNPKTFHEGAHLQGDVDMVAVITAILTEEQRRKLAGDLRPIPMRPDHGHQMLDDLHKKTNPGYSAIGRLKGLAEIRGVELALKKTQFRDLL